MTGAIAKATRPPTQRELGQYWQLVEEKRGYDRLSRALDADISSLRTIITAWLRAETNEPNRIKRRLGFVLRLVTSAGRVAWKTEFVRHFGSERAVKLQTQAPPVERLEIDKL